MTRMLMQTGFSEYEARAYQALLAKSPATAYEVAKASGIPSSKIYEVVARLKEKGVVSAMAAKGPKRYVPLGHMEFVDGIRTRTESTINALRVELEKASRGAEVSYIWNIGDYEYLMDKARKMVDEARGTLLLSIWKEEMEGLAASLGAAEKREVMISIVHFGLSDTKVGVIFQHPIAETIYTEKGGRGMVIVSDSGEALVATISADGLVEGAASSSRGFVTLAEDYIKHDVYIMKIIKRFDRYLRERFGERYELMRDVFSDRERP